jgi:hypothetical protein
MNIWYLSTLRRVESPKDWRSGRWMIECSFCGERDNSCGWRLLSFGVYKVIGPVPTFGRLLQQKHLRGFYRQYRVWLPFERVV